jgi:hypothetical protein
VQETGRKCAAFLVQLTKACQRAHLAAFPARPPVIRRLRGKGRSRFPTRLRKHVGDVFLHRPGRDSELLADFAVRQAPHEQREDASLPFGQRTAPSKGLLPSQEEAALLCRSAPNRVISAVPSNLTSPFREEGPPYPLETVSEELFQPSAEENFSFPLNVDLSLTRAFLRAYLLRGSTASSRTEASARPHLVRNEQAVTPRRRHHDSCCRTSL